MTKPYSPAILIVDDTPANIDVLAGILSPNYIIRAARDGIKALESVDKNPPDLILLDIMMPGIDGYTVCRRLKANPKTRNIPVLFVTAKSEDVDEYQGFEAGAMDYLIKPVHPLVVMARVKTHLSLAASRRELEKQNETLQEVLRLREDVERITNHDLKSPLTAIINIPPMLMRDKNQTPDQIEMLEILRKSGFRMLEMINRSLDLYKMEQGLYRLNSVSVDVAKIVRDIFAELRSLVSAKRIKTSFLIDGLPATDSTECFFPGEEFLFFSMLSNLIKNAMEASPEWQEVVVTLRSNDGYCIEVKNQGEIPSAIRAHFMERYVTHGKKDGTGLGGYSARLMAKTLGGELQFKSAKESGTILTLRIPKGEIQTLRTTSIDQTVVPPSKTRAEMGVLVVDDYGYMRKIISDILRQMGFGHIQEAENVLEAEAFLEENPFDLIISDWNMPDRTGLELLKTVRSRADGSQIPFIFIIGVATKEIIVLSRRNGVTDLLTKPFSPDVLKHKIDAIFCTKI
ncbi:MAG: response regulator [Candidatus Riflebacteria bacterium]|nr:response regulator [Candidatus Riflebacteria bacterium]